MGGLATALACAHEGMKNITVYESAPALGEVGAGKCPKQVTAHAKQLT